mgnify:CR=1 FL=1
MLNLWWLKYEYQTYGWRWTAKRVYSTLTFHNLRTLRTFFKWGWRLKHVRPWDYTYLLDMMALQLGDMQKDLEADDIHMNAGRYARQVMVAKVLCLRLAADEYFPQANDMFIDRNYNRYKSRVALDLELLGKQLKHIRSWWS